MLHFSTSDPENCSFGPVWDPQIPPKSTQKRLPGRPSGPKMASKPSLGPPRWPSRRAPSPPNRLPDRPRSNFGRPGSLQAPILVARDPFWLRFGGPKRHFGRPETNFPPPKHPFSSPDSLFPQSSSPPVLHASNPPILQDWRGGMRGAASRKSDRMKWLCNALARQFASFHSLITTGSPLAPFPNWRHCGASGINSMCDALLPKSTALEGSWGPPLGQIIRNPVCGLRDEMKPKLDPGSDLGPKR